MTEKTINGIIKKKVEKTKTREWLLWVLATEAYIAVGLRDTVGVWPAIIITVIFIIAAIALIFDS